MKRKSLFLIFCKTRKMRRCVVLCFLIPAASIMLWTAAAETRSHYTPDYGQMDLTPLLEKELQQLSETDYALLLYQTGVACPGVDALYEAGRQEELHRLQQRFFAQVEVECTPHNLIARSEKLVGKEEKRPSDAADLWDVGALSASNSGVFLAAPEEGDILVSFSGHVFGWRSGHAAIVVDSEAGKTLEALTLSVDSQIVSIERWRDCPIFALLRLKGASKQRRAEIAAYAAEQLVGLPYKLGSFAGETVPAVGGERGIGGETDAWSGGLPEGTHCAHLVWAAYAQFGYDIDGDGGFVVTPADLYLSDLLEVVQIYGMWP